MGQKQVHTDFVKLKWGSQKYLTTIFVLSLTFVAPAPLIQIKVDIDWLEGHILWLWEEFFWAENKLGLEHAQFVWLFLALILLIYVWECLNFAICQDHFTQLGFQAQFHFMEACPVSPNLIQHQHQPHLPKLHTHTLNGILHVHNLVTKPSYQTLKYLSQLLQCHRISFNLTQTQRTSNLS